MVYYPHNPIPISKIPIESTCRPYMLMQKPVQVSTLNLKPNTVMLEFISRRITEGISCMTLQTQSSAGVLAGHFWVLVGVGGLGLGGKVFTKVHVIFHVL